MMMMMMMMMMMIYSKCVAALARTNEPTNKFL